MTKLSSAIIFVISCVLSPKIKQTADMMIQVSLNQAAKRSRYICLRKLSCRVAFCSSENTSKGILYGQWSGLYTIFNLLSFSEVSKSCMIPMHCTFFCEFWARLGCRFSQNRNICLKPHHAPASVVQVWGNLRFQQWWYLASWFWYSSG